MANGEEDTTGASENSTPEPQNQGETPPTQSNESGSDNAAGQKPDTDSDVSISKQFDPSKVTNPLQLFALLLGAIVIAFITATTLAGSDKASSFIIALSSLIFAFIIAFFVINYHQTILLTQPWVLFSPEQVGKTEYTQLATELAKRLVGKATEEIQENTRLLTSEAAEKTKTAIKDELQKTGIETRRQEEIIETINRHIDQGLKAIPLKIEQRSFVDSALSFEITVREALTELPVAVKSEERIGTRVIDYILTKPDGSAIPVETKFVLDENIISQKMLEIIERDMTRAMKALNSTLSIVILSSPIPEKLQGKTDEITKMQKMHFIDGITKEVIKIKIRSIMG